MSLETIVDDLVAATEALHTAVTDKRTVLDAAAQAAAASLTTTQGLQTQAAASAATAAAKATEATNNATQIAAYKTAAAALDTSTTATAAVTNLLPDMLAKKDPARHPFRKKMPTLVLDFERQKCHRYSPSTGFGETPLATFMTFARNSTATYTGPDGLIKTAAANEARYDYDPLTGECKGLLVEEQRTNLLAYSDRPSQWVVNSNTVKLPTGIVSPEAKLGVVKLTGAVGVLSQHLTVTGLSSAIADNTVVVGSVYVKPAELSKVRLNIYTKDNNYPSVNFNLTTKSVISTTPVSGDTISGGVIDVGGGWLRCYAVCSVRAGAKTPAFLIELIDSSGNNNFISDGTSGLYVWGAQVEAGSFPTSYIPTPAVFTGRASTATYLDANGVVQTAASGVARSNAYDYDSDGVLRPIELLLESAATNLLLYSEQFDNAAWIKYTGSITANAATAPDGTATADLFTSSGTVQSRIEYVAALPTSDTVYTFSFYAKKGSNNYVSADHYSGSKDNYVIFDIANGAIVNQSAGVTSRITKVGSSWYRCSMTITVSASLTHNLFKIVQTDGVTYSTSETGGYFYAWGAQLEVGNYATSYIPTTSAQVTRAADTSTSAQATRAKDAAKVDGVNFSDWHNIDGFTAFATYEWGVDVNQQAFGRGVFGFSDTNNSNSWCYVYNGSTRSALVANTNSGQQFYKASDSPNEPANVMRSIAFRYKKNNAAVSFNGGSVASDTNCELPVFNNLNIGSTSLSNVYRLGGHVKRIVVYPTAFTDEELQALTSA